MRSSSAKHTGDWRATLTAAQAAAVDDGWCRLVLSGCDGPHYAGGYCSAHYHRVVRRGYPGDPVVKRRRRRLTRYENTNAVPCRFPGCTEPSHGLGYCGGHYTRLVTYGTPGTTQVAKRGSWKPPDVDAADLAAALEQAGGDMSLLAIEPDGRVVVAPRRTQPWAATGRPIGRPRAFDDAGLRHAAELLSDAARSVASVAAELGVSVSTLYNYFPELGQKRRPANPSA